METICQEAKSFLKDIPAGKWTTNDYSSKKGNAHCALGWINLEYAGHPGRWSKQTYDLTSAVYQYLTKQGIGGYDACLANVNDGHIDFYPQPTPKKRVMALLDDCIKAGL